MMRVLSVDPGTYETAWLLLDPSTREVHGFGKVKNEDFLVACKERAFSPTVPYLTVMEGMESFGRPVGKEVLDTVFWSGRFAEHCAPWTLIYRSEIKLHLCNSRRAKDPEIRQALLDRFGGRESVRKGGKLSGVKGDVWSALAIAVTFCETKSSALLHC